MVPDLSSFTCDVRTLDEHAVSLGVRNQVTLSLVFGLRDGVLAGSVRCLDPSLKRDGLNYLAGRFDAGLLREAAVRVVLA